MHELTVCRDIIKSLEDNLEPVQLENLHEIHLRIGKLSGIEPMYLKSAFKILTESGPYREVRLEIDYRDILAECDLCETRFSVEDYRFVCPNCQHTVEQIIEGNELEIHKVIMTAEEDSHEEIA